MFKVGDKVKMKPDYGQVIEDIFGLDRRIVYIVGGMEVVDDDLYLAIEFIYLRADFFEPAMKIGFTLDEVA